MKVKIKRSPEMKLGNTGIELAICENDGKHVGDLRIGKAIIEWCKGKTRKGNGCGKKWDELIRFFDPSFHAK